MRWDLCEAEVRLADGIQLGYFDAVSCEKAFRFAKRCLGRSEPAGFEIGSAQ